MKAVAFLNFYGPTVEVHLEAIRTHMGGEVRRYQSSRLYDVNWSENVPDQIAEVVDQLNIHPSDIAGARFVLALPPHSFLAALLLTEVTGRIGYLPSVVRTVPIRGSDPPQFHIVGVESLRDIHRVAEECRWK